MGVKYPPYTIPPIVQHTHSLHKTLPCALTPMHNIPNAHHPVMRIILCAHQLINAQPQILHLPSKGVHGSGKMLCIGGYCVGEGDAYGREMCMGDEVH